MTSVTLKVGALCVFLRQVVLELCLLHMLRGSVTAAGLFDAGGRGGQRKAIYLAPTKALLHEKMRVWKESFADTLGLVFKVRCLNVIREREWTGGFTRELVERPCLQTTTECDQVAPSKD
jgi:hypothetical protein